MNETKCNLIIIDNFYKNPYDVRNFALQQEFKQDVYYPGKRTKSFANVNLKNKFEEYIKPFAGKINNFDYYGDNGSFQIATSNDSTWIHCDQIADWAGIIYLTPDAPLSSGTAFYKFIDNTTSYDQTIKSGINYKDYSKDKTKWQIVDQVGNVFNRLILFNSKRYHSSVDYFGINNDDSRLFQVFFFSTEF
jgi:hypothetical protein